MEHPNAQIAPCIHYFLANGGTVSESGKALLQGDFRLLCGKAFDCGLCPHLRKWIDGMTAQGFVVGWECVDCIKFSKKRDDAAGIQRILEGYFHSGVSDDPDRPILVGCTHMLEEDRPEREQWKGDTCGFESPLLQLILRRKKEGT